MLAKLAWSPPRLVRGNASFVIEAVLPGDDPSSSMTHDGLVH